MNEIQGLFFFPFCFPPIASEPDVQISGLVLHFLTFEKKFHVASTHECASGALGCFCSGGSSLRPHSFPMDCRGPRWICLEQAVTVGVRDFWPCFAPGWTSSTKSHDIWTERANQRMFLSSFHDQRSLSGEQVGPSTELL